MHTQKVIMKKRTTRMRGDGGLNPRKKLQVPTIKTMITSGREREALSVWLFLVKKSVLQ